MEEKVIIKSERCNLKKFLMVILCIGIALFLLFVLLDMDELKHVFSDEYTSKYGSDDGTSALTFGFVLFCLPVWLLGLFLYFGMSKIELVVSESRVYGKAMFGKQVDLPMDSISATSTIQLFKGIAVATSSGKINFYFVKNATEIQNVIREQLMIRQRNKNVPQVVMAETKNDEADMLKKYKDLLDSGVITQEEFDQKKKQLLGL